MCSMLCRRMESVQETNDWFRGHHPSSSQGVDQTQYPHTDDHNAPQSQQATQLQHEPCLIRCTERVVHQRRTLGHSRRPRGQPW